MDQPTAGDREVAAGGWRRAVIGLLVGVVAGALVALLLPRDGGQRRLEAGRDAG